MFPYPHIIELVHGLFYDFWVISQYACFEVASSFSLHANSRTREVRTSYIHFLAIKNKHLEMNTRTKHTLQTVIEYRVLVKVLPEVWAWSFA